MKTLVFSVYDSKVHDFTQPFHMLHKGECLRGFKEVVNDPSTKFNKYPEDYTLFHLGEFDSATGKFTNLDTPESLGLAINFLDKK